MDFNRFTEKFQEGLRSAQGLASRNGQPSTNFLFLREGKVYFEGGQQALLESPDAYLKKFLV